MQYQITVLTVSARIPTPASGTNSNAPWSNVSGPIRFADPVLGSMRISDDDGAFHSGRYPPDETDQRLVDPLTIGHGSTAMTVPAGTPISNFIGSVMTASNGDQFAMIFPRRLVQGSLGTELGDRHSVLVVALPKTVDGAKVFPTFDPDLTFTFTSVQSIGTSNDALAYPPAPAPPEPEPEPEIVPCFAEGSLIRTATGLRPVQTLHPDDLVATLDHGMQPVLWVGMRRLDRDDLDLCPQHRPIRIAPGALGAGLPLRTLTVSPQHRILVRSRILARMLECPEALVAARHLVGLPGVTVRRDADAVTYWHVLLADHGLIEAEGAWTESLYPGPMALRSFGPAMREEIRTLLPDLAHGTMPAPARPFVSGRQARKLAERHARNTQPLMMA